MTRAEIISKFREENPEVTSRVITDSVLASWLLSGNVDFATRLRCIVDQDGTTIGTTEDQTYIDLVGEISNFYDIDEMPGSGVLYNGKRIKKTTMGALDKESPTWRARDVGTPRQYYRRGQYIYFDRPVDSNEEDVIIYSVLLPDDFDSDSKEPLNGLTYLRPFHDGLVRYLEWRAKGKIGKREDALKAYAEYETFAKWAKRELGGGKFGPTYFIRGDV